MPTTIAGEKIATYRRPAWFFILLGFACAPFALEVPILLIAVILEQDPFGVLTSSAFLPLIFVFHIACLTFGVPAFLILELLKKRKVSHYLIGGAVAGAFLPLMLFLISGGSSNTAPLFVYVALVGTFCGTLVALLFRWIVFGGSKERATGEIVDVFD